MSRELLIQSIFEKGKECNIEELEVYFEENSSLNFNIYEGKLDKYNVSKEEKLSLRGIYNGKMGYSYSEKMDKSAIEELLNNLIQYAENNDKVEIEELSVSSNEYSKHENDTFGLEKYSEEEKIEFLKSIEKQVLNANTRISTVNKCGYEEINKRIIIKNTKGLDLEDSYSVGVIELSIVAKVGDDVQTSYSYRIINDLSENDKGAVVKQGVSDAINLLGGSSIKSGNYEIILRNDVAANLFSSFSSVFLGDVVQRNMSLMKGKIGKYIGVDTLSIVEDPLMPGGIVCRAYDDEGTPTYSKYVVQKGILKTFLHNKRTAEKAGLKSTGNGFRDSHKSSIGVLSTNMYIEPGNSSLEDMISSLNKGIIITDIQGLHAGINAISGDFSLYSKGFLVENGKISKPVSRMTIAGNLYKLLNEITAIGNDIKFSFPGANYFGSPSLKINCLTVAGD